MTIKPYSVFFMKNIDLKKYGERDHCDCESKGGRPECSGMVG
jgi:hypothetical protein